MRLDHEAAVRVVAHEIAHVVRRDIVGAEAERAADSQARRWGVEKEIAALQAANPRHRWTGTKQANRTRRYPACLFMR